MSPRWRGGKPLLLVALVCAAAAASFAWWWRIQQRIPELESDWNARVVVLAGDGTVGTRSGTTSETRFDEPFGVAVRADGTIFVADGTSMPRVRAISPDGRVFDVAGGGRGFRDGPAQTAQFATISGIALDAVGTIYVADTGNNAIRRITPDGHVSTLAGDGIAGYVDGPAAQARFNGPLGVAVDAAGRVIVADTYNDRIRRIDPNGSVTTLAPSYFFHTPAGVAVGASGHIYIANSGTGAALVLNPAGEVTTLPYVDGTLRPVGVALSPDGALYLADERGRIVEFTANGGARIVAGGAPGFLDGRGDEARFRRPSGVAVISPGRLVVADTGNALIRLVAAASKFEFRPPPPPAIGPRFDSASFGLRPLLWPVEPMEGPHEIAGTMGEARGTDAERLHAGVDVRVEDGTPVLAVRSGVVSSPISTGEFGSLNEWLRVGPVTYVHIRAGRGRGDVPLDPDRFVPTYDDEGTMVGMRVKRGAWFETGEVIGSVNRFNHVHMNVGWPGEEHNPLDFRLVQFTDSIAPSIARGGVTLVDEAGTRLTARERGRLLVSGSVQIIVDAWDRADGNRPNRRLAPYSLGYQVLNADGTPAEGFEQPIETIRLDQLGREADPRLMYAPGSGIPFYGGRTTRFLFNVTNTFGRGAASAGRWDTTALPPGDYTVRVFATDSQGNTTTQDLKVAVLRF